jgi:hypothetical protein
MQTSCWRWRSGCGDVCKSPFNCNKAKNEWILWFFQLKLLYFRFSPIKLSPYPGIEITSLLHSLHILIAVSMVTAQTLFDIMLMMVGVSVTLKKALVREILCQTVWGGLQMSSYGVFVLFTIQFLHSKWL